MEHILINVEKDKTQGTAKLLVSPLSIVVGQNMRRIKHIYTLKNRTIEAQTYDYKTVKILNLY